MDGIATGSAPPARTDEGWLADFFRDADRLDLPLLTGWFGEDIDLRIANMPPMLGLPAAEEAFRQFWSTIKGMSHEVQQRIVNGRDGMQLSIVTYTRLDDRSVAVPVASHLRRRPDGRLDRLWIYIDLAPLFAE
ncbi:MULTISPECIES: nuclear transport factor 2 family protein [unclassified Sphingomonas]|uniref:nuclear transport factor 2 family protein n=1 Tax=unclassified Sphingomonas TaxID=196159 RepID=UPI0006FFE23C|nr:MULTISPECIES: nuclear transport factor 2 family protein [unclassified Sphingomonas]KQX19524.1 hypothetical protein ASD17_13495 [Sphingomonas sp. Root1294]KQY65725.1 hypothetical protein ASD39_16695 [Sphingomonas sp. Root50]KRB94970.1 hypothetical protein ASE22_03360 [Sphingomonas sp. Root720]